MKQQLVNQTKGTGFFLSAWQIMGFSSLMETLIYFKTTSNMLQEQILEIFCSPPPIPILKVEKCIWFKIAQLIRYCSKCFVSLLFVGGMILYYH